jgi:3'-5' exoribonuclease
MSDPKQLIELADGEDFVGFYALKRCDLREFDGGERLDIEISDATGSIPGVVWEDARMIHGTLQKGGAVKVMGRLGSYRDRPQVRIDRIRPAEEGEYDPDAFLPVTPRDRDDLMVRLRDHVASITDPWLSKLVALIFDNEKFVDLYARAPGGVRWHHPYIGGLLEHSIGVTDICSDVAARRPELNRDLLVLAGLLHDSGKIREFDIGTTIEYSNQGRLEGHIVIGERFVRNTCDKFEGFPDELKLLLSHLLLSHQGRNEFATPVEPMIPEAFVLYHADEIDSKLNAVDRIIDRSRKAGDSWTGYVKLLDRMLFADRPDLDPTE